MLNVPNRKCIRRLSLRSFRAARVRNTIAVLAIALTTLMFTALFTIGLSIVASYEQQNFRSAGGWNHGSFKGVTETQIQTLSEDPRIVRDGARLMLGTVPSQPPFNKAQIEVSYMDADCADFSFALPTTGTLPREGTREAVLDTRVLALLGIQPTVGATFSLPVELGSSTAHPVILQETFTLSGWFPYDEATYSSQVVLARSCVEDILSRAHYQPQGDFDLTGKWTYNIMLKNAAHIETDLRAILSGHGYQCDTVGTADYIDIGVNWGYVGAQFSSTVDIGTLLAAAVLLVIMTLTGYLIIYNIFMISVTNDIRFYGLLKTIGTTGRQLRRIIRTQALLLSCIGIPIGLLTGHFAGARLTPFIMAQLSYPVTTISFSPLIFICAALFSLLTVLISCRRPGRIAGRVSPVEAVRYTEGGTVRRRARATRSAKVSHMALANLGRSKSKTVLVVLSLCLSVLLLTITFTFTNGFDMDKYLADKSVADFIFGHASYFQTGSGFQSSEEAVTEDLISEIHAQGGVTGGGRVYGQTTPIDQFVTEDWYRTVWGTWNSPDTVDRMVELCPRTADGLLETDAKVYGMDAYALDHLKLIEGNLSALYDPDQHAIAAVYEFDDYGALQTDSHWAKVGDTITLRHIDSYQYRDFATGELIDPSAVSDRTAYFKEPKTYRDISYTVVACVGVPHNMGYRYFGSDQFVMNDQIFCQDTGTSDIMTYLFDVEESAVSPMTAFLETYTTTKQASYDFESKQTYVDEFNGFRSMFLLMGSVLSGIIGLVGILNFLNAVLTSIMTRRREFAVLQAIGMTGRQLKQMLVIEGLFYGTTAIAASFALSLLLGLVMRSSMEQMFWFFSYHYTALPILLVLPVFLLLGVLIPLVSYRTVSRQSLVDRIREID